MWNMLACWHLNVILIVKKYDLKKFGLYKDDRLFAFKNEEESVLEK